jgi:hypothetical protein
MKVLSTGLVFLILGGDSIMTREDRLKELFLRVYGWLVSDTVPLGTPEWRAELERELSLAISDTVRRGGYQYVLLKTANASMKQKYLLPVYSFDIPIETIFQSGWSILDDRRLANLALNLVAIEPLAGRYEQAFGTEKMGEVWEKLTEMTMEEMAEVPEHSLHNIRQLTIDRVFGDMTEADALEE